MAYFLQSCMTLIKARENRNLVRLLSCKPSRHTVVVFIISLLLQSCKLDPNARVLGLAPRDTSPPVLTSRQSFEDHFILHFDEPLKAASLCKIKPQLAFNPEEVAHISGKTLTIQLKEKTIPGRSYLMQISVADNHYNTLNFLLRVYGKNSNPARLLINELNPEGSKSSNSPELIEFYVLEGGNIGGLTFTVGSLEENKGDFVFPTLAVSSGDYILLHTRWDPQNKYDIRRVDETQSKDQAKARLSSDDAWDFWADKISGLSSTNGALAIYKSPQGGLLDAVIYSTSETAERYRGWKTSYLERQVDRLAELGAWRGENQLLVPEDAIRSKDSSGTRSLSRVHDDGMPTDTDRATDWIVVPNGKYSFGRVNILERYIK